MTREFYPIGEVMKVCVVGAGISGLSTAQYLSRYHDVEVFVYEQSSTFGGRANILDGGEHCPRVFLNDYHYLFEIFKDLRLSDGSTVYDSLTTLQRYWASSRSGWVELSHTYSIFADEVPIGDRLRVLRAKRISPLIAEQEFSGNTNRYGSWRNYSLRSLLRIIMSLARFASVHDLGGRTDRVLTGPWVDNLRTRGVTLVTDTPVLSLHPDSSGVVVELADHSERFDAVVVTAYASDASRLLESSGLPHRIPRLSHIHCKVFTLVLDPREKILEREPAIYSRQGLNILFQPRANRCVVLCLRSRSTSRDFVTARLREYLDLEHDFVEVRERDNQADNEAIFSADFVDQNAILVEPAQHIYFAGSYTKNSYPVDSGEGAARAAFNAVERLAGDFHLTRDFAGRTIVPNGTPYQVPLTVSQRYARRAILALAGRISVGELVVAEKYGETVSIGPGGHPTARIDVNSPETWTRLVRGMHGCVQSYCAGDWESPDLVAVLRLAARNVSVGDDLRRKAAFVRVPLLRLRAGLGRHTRAQSRRDIAFHYDLGNDLFAAMLDETMSYSCAVFPGPDSTLSEAAHHKMELVCAKLDLRRDDRVLEIGGGWGGFAVYAARTRGCHVTMTTISNAQYTYARQHVQRLGLTDLIDVRFEDYRDTTGSFDKLVSIEMVEAVGADNLGTFFGRCSELLKPGGLMLLQAITIDDRAYEVAKLARTFIRSYIFPNGCLPSLEVISRTVARRTDMYITGLDDYSSHYARTLACWRANIGRAQDDIQKRGYDLRFQRLWGLYLAYCEAGFLEHRIRLIHATIVKPSHFAVTEVGRCESTRPQPVSVTDRGVGLD
ncbi:FAD-dependent oxidoreductase [Nocardia sp. NPDC056611]|uniref:FAD-dependent oxidoreductase n=1 Tax=Nocardia sp. NPDC056611 TaxID=3345877 RepID=UPI00366F79EC